MAHATPNPLSRHQPSLSSGALDCLRSRRLPCSSPLSRHQPNLPSGGPDCLPTWCMPRSSQFHAISQVCPLEIWAVSDHGAGHATPVLTPPAQPVLWSPELPHEPDAARWAPKRPVRRHEGRFAARLAPSGLVRPLGGPFGPVRAPSRPRSAPPHRTAPQRRRRSTPPVVRKQCFCLCAVCPVGPVGQKNTIPLLFVRCLSCRSLSVPCGPLA